MSEHFEDSPGAIQIISDQVKVKYGDWISVKDRLPNFDIEVVTYESDGFYRIGYLMEDPINNSKGNWFGAEGIEFFPSHWMPLPEPPAEES